MFEYVTLISSIILLFVTLLGFYKVRGLEYLSWLVSSSSFFLLAIALVLLGLDALQLPITPYLGSLYPSFLALGLIMIKSRKYSVYYLLFIFLMLILISLGIIYTPSLKTISQISLHVLSGLVIIILPIYYSFKNLLSKYAILISLGGITIGIGGMALATIIAGKPILPPDLVVQLLHPILSLSAILLAIGIYAVKK